MADNTVPLNQKLIQGLLAQMGGRLSERGQLAEVAIFGGSALALLYDFRDTTVDVDFYPIKANRNQLIETAKEVATASELSIEEDWFNDAVEVFLSDNPSYQFFGEFPKENPGIRVFIAAPEYIFCMKALAMRSITESQDVKDVWDILDHIDVTTMDDAYALLDVFYPGKKLPKRQEYALMDILEAKGLGEAFNPVLGW